MFQLDLQAHGDGESQARNQCPNEYTEIQGLLYFSPNGI